MFADRRPDRLFDTLLCAHVLEHLDEATGVELIRTYLPYLRPKARVILITPQERGQRSDATHVRFMDEPALTRLARAVRTEDREDLVVPSAESVRTMVHLQRDDHDRPNRDLHRVVTVTTRRTV